MLIQMAKENEIDNFIVLDLMPKQKLVAYIQNALVSVVPLKGTPVLDTSSPNKFFESLAAGIPVVQNTQGWIKELLIEHNVGYTLDPNNPLDLANLLVDFKDNPSKFQYMGEKAKVVAKENFDKSYLANKMLKIIERVHDNKI